MSDYGILPEHMRDGARNYVERGQPAGHFLTAVLENDFVEACCRADPENGAALRTWALWVHNETPHNCHGSRDIVAKWIESGGLAGQQPPAAGGS